VVRIIFQNTLERINRVQYRHQPLSLPPHRQQLDQLLPLLAALQQIQLYLVPDLIFYLQSMVIEQILLLLPEKKSHSLAAY
jgi:hypothetical protein